jgi:hypothetical protein
MSTEDSPITRVGNLGFAPDDRSRYNGMYTPQLDPIEIANIPVDASKVGGIIFNKQAEELQYLAPTFNWINVTTDLSDPTFVDLTVTGSSTLNTLSTTGLAKFLGVETKTLTSGSAQFSDDISITGTTASTNLTITGTGVINDAHATNLTVGGNIITEGHNITKGYMIGQRPGASLINHATPEFAVTANTAIKIPGTTTERYAAFLTTDNNKIQGGDESSPYPASFTMLCDYFFSFTFTADGIVQLLIAVNGVPQDPAITQVVSMGNPTHISGSCAQVMVMNSPTLSYIELWVKTTVNGSFTAGGTMSLTATQL